MRARTIAPVEPLGRNDAFRVRSPSLLVLCGASSPDGNCRPPAANATCGPLVVVNVSLAANSSCRPVVASQLYWFDRTSVTTAAVSVQLTATLVQVTWPR